VQPHRPVDRHVERRVVADAVERGAGIDRARCAEPREKACELAVLAEAVCEEELEAVCVDVDGMPTAGPAARPHPERPWPCRTAG
jgi:hypothetical protein